MAPTDYDIFMFMNRGYILTWLIRYVYIMTYMYIDNTLLYFTLLDYNVRILTLFLEEKTSPTPRKEHQLLNTYFDKFTGKS